MGTNLRKPSEVVLNHDSYSRDTKSKIYDGHVLGYITPWNSHGYNVAKIFGNKFSSISPVWLHCPKCGGGKRLHDPGQPRHRQKVDVGGAQERTRNKDHPASPFRQVDWAGLHESVP